MEVFKISELSKEFAGAVPGRKVFAALVGLSTPKAEPTLSVLDFGKVAVATASFLRESVFGFRDYARTKLNTIYPVVANATPAVSEELEFFASQTGDAIWLCQLSGKRISNSRVLGSLEAAERETFDLIRRHGRQSAPDLAVRRSDLRLATTAWNNRLASLSAKGLVMELPDGKRKNFDLVLRDS